MYTDGYFDVNKTKEELIEIYKILTQRYFTVIAPRSAFLTTEQLETLEANPYIGGMEVFSVPYEMKITVEKMIDAYLLGGDGFQLSFRYPKKDIPVIYEALQNAIRLWTDLKFVLYEHETAPMKELEAMELVSKSLFQHYRIFYLEGIKDVKTKFKDEDLLCLHLLKNRNRKIEEISFISYLDIYRDRLRRDFDPPMDFINNFTLQENSYAGFDLDKGYPTMDQLETNINHDMQMWNPYDKCDD